MKKENSKYGDYIIIPAYSCLDTIYEDFTTYITSPDDIKIFSTMTILEIVEIILKLSIINASSLLLNICDTPENILRCSQVILYLPISVVYSIIPTMIIISSYNKISIIVSILLNIPLSAFASIIANMTIPLDIIFPSSTNRYVILNLIKSDILSNKNIPAHKAAIILSDLNIPRYQVEIILSHMSIDKSSLISLKMPL